MKPQDRLRLPGVRRAVAQVAGPLPRVRRVELAGRGAARARGGRRPASTAKRYALAGGRRAAALRRHRHGRRRAAVDRHRRVRSRARRRRRARVAGAARRRAGIGKSTLLLQAAAHFAQHDRPGALQLGRGVRAPDQVARRAARRRARAALPAGRDLPRAHPRGDRAARAGAASSSTRSRRCSRCKFQSAPGSIGQVREAATQLLFAAKGQNIPTFLVGHVTKDGSLAGPKALEHIVDTVLYFEGEKHHAHRVVRAVKNRFGAVSELGVFEMTGTGLQGGAEPVAAVPGRAARERAGVRGAVLRRGVAPAARRGAGARQHQHRTATRGGWRAASIRIGCRCCWPCSRSAPA